MDWKISLLSLVTGSVVGIIFTALKLPLPAPPVLSGILGIVGIWFGSILYQWLARFWS